MSAIREIKSVCTSTPKIWLGNLCYESVQCPGPLSEGGCGVGAAFCSVSGAVQCWWLLAPGSTLGVSFVWWLKCVLCCVLIIGPQICPNSLHIAYFTFEQSLSGHAIPKTGLSWFLRVHCVWPVIVQRLLRLTPVISSCRCFQGRCYYPTAGHCVITLGWQIAHS